MTTQDEMTSKRPLWMIEAEAIRLLDLNDAPFSPGDLSAGVENEFQTAVRGHYSEVDLAQNIAASSFYAGVMLRAKRGDIPHTLVDRLERYLQPAGVQYWENSWVHFPKDVLAPETRAEFERDLLVDRNCPVKGRRSDASRYTQPLKNGVPGVRIPVSDMLKLALVDATAQGRDWPEELKQTAARLLRHFSNDNTSPEITSFYISPLRSEQGLGMALARECGLRFLLLQLLCTYANDKFELRKLGQEVVLYSAPNTPGRQTELNNIIPDSFYRELFMSPCLSGWDRGHEKHEYMHLCHQVLSRSHLHAISKLREASIINNDLIVLPNLSNTSLTNNGTHISLGSFQLTQWLGDGRLRPEHEKCLGDLVAKCVEHFLPLFVGSYSAAPYRIPYTAFYPERVLGFLPHELDYTHLRMLWRRWQKKADVSLFGRALRPFGPQWLDGAVARLFGLRGDFVPDFRLIDYFAALLGTDESPSLDGRMGNWDRLKRNLQELGIYDARMAFYCLYRLREFEKDGYSGFEGRYYSLFPSFTADLAPAVNLQVLISALAYSYILNGTLRHVHIPDDPTTESERRQIFFATAIGIPTIFIRKTTPDLMLRRILGRAAGARASRRYPGYVRVNLRSYLVALLDVLECDGAELIERFALGGLVTDLRARLAENSRTCATTRLLDGIAPGITPREALQIDAHAFNAAAEAYYRDDLRISQLKEGLDCLRVQLRTLECKSGLRHMHSLIQAISSCCDPCLLLDRALHEITSVNPDRRAILDLIALTLAVISDLSAEAATTSRQLAVRSASLFLEKEIRAY